MKKVAFLCVLSWSAAILPLLGQISDEARQLEILNSPASLAEKEAACLRLKQVGGIASVPTLSVLLRDEKLSQGARDALETMPVEAAGDALRDALGSTSGKLKAGIVHSIGERRDNRARPALAALLLDSDTLIAVNAVGALARIGGNDSIKALQKAKASAREPIRSALVDALLQCAVQFESEGSRSAAGKIYRALADSKEKEHIRLAAHVGLLRVAGDKALALVVADLTRKDPAAQSAALLLAHKITDPAATATYTNLLPKSLPALQIALLRVLQQRADLAAAPAVVAATRSQDVSVRTAAITALGTLGNAPMVPLLAEAASSRDEAEQKAARQVLLLLRGPEVAESLVAQLASARPSVQGELLGALVARREKSAVPGLLTLAQSDTPALRHASVQALSKLADSTHLPSLVKLLTSATDSAARDEVRGVLEAIAERSADGSKADVAPVAEGLAHGNTDTRIALLPVSALFADARLREPFRAALKDSDNRVRADAARALCNTRDPELMPDLLELAGNSEATNLRGPALAGYIRLACDTERSDFSPQKRIDLLKKALPLAAEVEDKRRVLSGLAGVAHPDALDLAEHAATEERVRAEAEIAVFQIAKALLAADSPRATASLGRLAANANHGQTRTNAQMLLKEFNSGWLYAGPYRRDGMQCRQLFDVPFPPETSQPGKVNWRPARGTPDLARPGEVNLNGAVDGNHCVLYLTTKVFVPTAQQAALEIGSDDGIKLWVNGALVHANNAVRGLTPAEDRAGATLNKGWNVLLAKITQQEGGCGMMLRITAPDHSEIPGLRFDPEGKEE